jgi:(E)-4-hydroxy-3-methylbut-2-enyl-diphosphate synthase
MKRRLTREVKVGNVGVGGDNPIRIQTMLTSDTMNTEACVREAIPILEAGCEILRLTAPSVNDARKLKDFVAEIRKRGFNTPIVADIHFVPAAAMEAALWVEKVRINPGNYADRKKFAVREYTDAEYEQELDRIEESFTPLVLRCKELGRAMRIGTNHGSLSDRIMNRYGDTPLGMVESALEFARICRKHDYHNIIFSMKASNPKVMIEAYRLLVARLDEEGPDWNYPLHLGVTEAGEGEDGRIKSAIGIGALLEDGLGDTVRVSLTEDSLHEIPVCRKLVAKYNVRQASGLSVPSVVGRQDACPTIRVLVLRANANVRVSDDVKPEGIYEDAGIVEINPLKEFPAPPPGKMVAVADGTPLEPIPAHRLLAGKLAGKNPILLKDILAPATSTPDSEAALLHAATVLGSLLCDGIGDAVLVRGETNPVKSLQLAYNILQAAGARRFKTDYVACPSCGRTQFDLQTVTARIKARTSHLKGVKIAVMGCIVNGPGEMADADFGYVGTAPGKISLWVGKRQVKEHIPEELAVDELVALIKEHGKWTEPPA